MSVRVSTSKQWGVVEVDIRVRLPDGTRHRERTKSPVQSTSGAKRWAEERERYLALHGNAQPQKEVPTLEEFSKRFIEDYAKANKLKASGIAAKQTVLEKHLVPVLGKKRLNEIGDYEVQKVKRHLAAMKPKTVNCVLTVLSKLLKIAVDWKELASMPVSVKMVKSPDPELPFYDFEEFEQLVEGAGKAGADVLAFVLLAGEAGLRRGEIIALERSDVDFKRNQITVRQSDWQGQIDTPKSGKTRRVPMTARLAVALQAIRHLRGPRAFYQRDGKLISANTLRSWMQRAQARAGLPLTSGVHILRHTFCSHLAMRGAPVRAIQELAGHADLSTTMRYMHLSPASLNQAIRLLEQRPPFRGEIGESSTPPQENTSNSE